jgi:hypothetical protein
MFGRSRRHPFRRLLLWGGVAAAGRYLFDQQEGAQRRANLQDQLRGLVQGKRSDIGRSIEERGPRQGLDFTDNIPPTSTLKEKVESEVLRHDRYPKGKIVVDAIGGVVTLRGTLDSRELIDQLEQEVRKVDGVVEVENLIKKSKAR